MMDNLKIIVLVVY